MFERIRNIVKGIGQLIYNPNLLEDYRSALATAKYYQEMALQDKARLQEAYGQVNTELSFRKEMEAEGIAVGHKYIDKELGPELLQDAPWEEQNQTINVRVSYVVVTGFSVENGSKFIETNLGPVRAERFLDRKDQDKLVKIEQGLEEKNQREPAELVHISGYKELVEKMKDAGFFLSKNQDNDNFLMWEDIKTGKEFGLNDWQEVKDFISKIDQGKVSGILIYQGGRAQWYEDPDKYIKTYKEDLDEMGPMGVSARTIARDPKLRKAVDDLIYNEFGEENPYDLEYYAQQHSTLEPKSMEQQADGMEM